jgi:TubC N-terminal docking domain
MTLAELASMGFQVRIDGEQLKIKPKEKLTAALLDQIAAAKPALLLELRIRAMAGWWRYSPVETEHTLRLAAADPGPWRDLVADDERWRSVHSHRRPTVPEAGHG